MVSDIVYVIYGYTFLELILDIGAVYFAYRLTKITGAFRGWILMIIAVALITVQGTTSILTLILLFPESQLEALITSIGTPALIEGAVVGVAVSLSLFGAMFELYRTFKRLQTRQSSQ